MGKGYIKMMRVCDENRHQWAYLNQKPLDFALLRQIAERARRTPGWDEARGIHLDECEALIGDHSKIGLTRGQYRAARDRLVKAGLISVNPTPKGTVAKLTSSNIFDINPEPEKQPSLQPSERPSEQPSGEEAGVMKNQELTSRGDGSTTITSTTGATTTTATNKENQKNQEARQAKAADLFEKLDLEEKAYVRSEIDRKKPTSPVSYSNSIAKTIIEQGGLTDQQRAKMKGVKHENHQEVGDGSSSGTDYSPEFQKAILWAASLDPES